MLLQITNAIVKAIFICRVVTQPDNESCKNLGKKKIGARRIRTFDSGGIANYQKIIKKFKITTKVIKIIKTLVKLDCGRDFSGSKQKNRK